MPDLHKKHFTRLINKRFIEAAAAVVTDFDITATELGEKIEMTSSNISRLKNSDGELSVTVEALARLCDFYKVSAFWLLTGQGDMYNNDEVTAAKNGFAKNANKIEAALNDMQKQFSIIKKAGK